MRYTVKRLIIVRSQKGVPQCLRYIFTFNKEATINFMDQLPSSAINPFLMQSVKSDESSTIGVRPRMLNKICRLLSITSYSYDKTLVP